MLFFLVLWPIGIKIAMVKWILEPETQPQGDGAEV